MAGYNTKLGNDFNLDIGLGGNIRKYAYEKMGIEGGTGWKHAHCPVEDAGSKTAPRGAVEWARA